METSATMTIDAPIDRVFNVFTDLNAAQSNLSGIKSLELLEGTEQMSVGTRWRETRTMWGKDSTEEMWVSELTKNVSYAVDAQSHGTKYHSTFTFAEEGNATVVTWIFAGEPQTLFAKVMSLSAILFKGSLKKMLVQDLIELKHACEKAA